MKIALMTAAAALLMAGGAANARPVVCQFENSQDPSRNETRAVDVSFPGDALKIGNMVLDPDGMPTGSGYMPALNSGNYWTVPGADSRGFAISQITGPWVIICFS